MPHWSKTNLLETVKDMWMNGDSANYIADIVGHGITKNAIIGKMNRLGLTKRKKVRYSRYSFPTETSHSLPARSPRARAKEAIADLYENRISKRDQELRRQLQKAAKEEQIRAAEIALATTIIVPLEERRNLQAKTKDQCNWSFGHPRDPDFHYCHLQHEPGLPYCSVHLHRAYIRLPNTSLRRY